MTATAARLSLPRVANGPMAVERDTRLDRHEDWTEIENLLASPVPTHVSAGQRSRRRTAALGMSTILATVAFAGLLTAFSTMPRGACLLRLGDCEMPKQTASRETPATTEATARPSPPAAAVVPANRVADAGANSSDASPAIIQGRSASELDVAPDATAPVDVVPSEPKHGRQRHHHRRSQ